MTEEQRSNLAQLNSDRTQLAADRAEFDVKCRLRMEEQQDKFTRTVQVRTNQPHITDLVLDFVLIPFVREIAAFLVQRSFA